MNIKSTGTNVTTKGGRKRQDLFLLHRKHSNTNSKNKKKVRRK